MPQAKREQAEEARRERDAVVHELHLSGALVTDAPIETPYSRREWREWRDHFRSRPAPGIDSGHTGRPVTVVIRSCEISSR